MFEFISGKVVESGPAHVVLENNGLGYFVNISLTTYTCLKELKETSLYIHENIREDAYTLYGFHSIDERELFRHLISVSGIGANTARMMLSSLPPDELKVSILSGNANQLKGIKGIGLKTAQRVIVDLKDKLGKESIDEKLFTDSDNTVREEALSALVMLGFAKAASQKAVDKILSSQPDCRVEQIIKQALKML
ncbi:Holliday junction branch migration protein RuvA [Alkalitalea saponilacus]|uniref:Holliday junction branch migration complex subunit RuvA n=1 Tax=Alkalitalea saponilacus TaxID=889453 RepID=A0A1T5BYS4_9BACT|nr:Holliday junction branch migration protein RuvA [Alkalitalea saponilacus]ASB49537.1 Holliday junction branch migration protein RuvA [Alkalitalea saponilacus]SKB52291.1 Holliday junction DNA helicase subunit RuvA [Alkalitalea saponilacus]